MWWRKNPLVDAGKLMLDASFTHLQERQAACEEAWGLGRCDRWDANLEEGWIRFAHQDGRVITAPVQVVGSYSQSDSSWEWAWNNPNVEPRLAKHAELARDYAAEFKLKQFTSPILTCSEGDAWQFAAVACLVGEADGVYRAPFGDLLVFLTFGPVEIKASVAN
jgi:hypothetical protein